LDVNGNDPSPWAHHSGERYGEISHTWPDIQNGDAFSDVRSKDLFGVLKKLPYQVIESKAKPPRASMLVTHKQVIKETVHLLTASNILFYIPPIIYENGIPNGKIYTFQWNLSNNDPV
jgi:hypothetical protein